MKFLAEILTENPGLYTYGPMGVICAWFMWRGEKLAAEIRSLGHRIDGVTRAMLVDVLSREGSGPQAKKVAQDMLAKIAERDEAAIRRGYKV